MISGKRVTLRAMERDDLPTLHRYNNDLAVELAGGGDPPMPQPLAFLESEFEERASKGGRDDANFVIEADGQVIGSCALFNYDGLARTYELGITIGNKDYRGKGYGRETVRLLVDYAFRYRNANRVWLRVHAANERAIKAYTTAGFSEEGRLRQHVYSNGAYDDLVLMGVLRMKQL